MKILIAAGGTGGHLFPAQAFAEDLLREGAEVLFAGHGLESNFYFKKDAFSFRDVLSATPFQRNLKKSILSFFSLLKGVKEGKRVLQEFQPDLVVGFGSFHSFSVLAAAVAKKIPLVLFESNAKPGKVNRLFSRFAHVTAVQFEEAASCLQGEVVEIAPPIWEKEKTLSKEEALSSFSLDPHRRTVLVFGGSQGAKAINGLFSESARVFKDRLQVIHITGTQTEAEKIREFYAEIGMKNCVKPFEHHMERAWKAADFAICRSGAATIAEQLFFEVPGILIPFPHAADDHQTKNAYFMEKEVKGALTILENEANTAKLTQLIEQMLDGDRTQMMKENICKFKRQNHKGSLKGLVLGISRNICRNTIL